MASPREMLQRLSAKIRREFAERRRRKVAIRRAKKGPSQPMFLRVPDDLEPNEDKTSKTPISHSQPVQNIEPDRQDTDGKALEPVPAAGRPQVPCLGKSSSSGLASGQPAPILDGLVCADPDTLDTHDSPAANPGTEALGTDDDEDGDEAPIRPSAKALGKAKQIYPSEPDDEAAQPKPTAEQEENAAPLNKQQSNESITMAKSPSRSKLFPNSILRNKTREPIWEDGIEQAPPPQLPSRRLRQVSFDPSIPYNENSEPTQFVPWRYVPDPPPTKIGTSLIQSWAKEWQRSQAFSGRNGYRCLRDPSFITPQSVLRYARRTGSRTRSL
ncbi:hypothetical protein CDD82_7416 [Ophiocordyceps australis]|uniref:Uncharacterized protein n=1 Tax=Ophiocordyceps australis TaxID=1399860 RepID=A0A2C5YMG2_9HYPO|nr:hypothetical protein CDD82_7416 [Ophiocordyceps australis]